MAPQTTSQRHLTKLLEERERLFNVIQIRKTLGGFDANAEHILILMQATMAMISYQIALAEENQK